MKNRLIFVMALAAAMAAAGVARASTMVRLSLSQLTQASSDIVEGHVVSQQAAWTPDHTSVVTVATVAVDQVIKGPARSEVLVTQPGGTVGNFHLQVAGAAQFLDGSRYLLFLEPAAGTDDRIPVGMVQGVCRIYHDDATGSDRVILPAMEIENASRGPDQTVSLTEFRRELSRVLAAAPVVPAGTNLPVRIERTAAGGNGSTRIVGRTTADLFPDSKTVIPAGSEVEGQATRTAAGWNVRWSSVSIRGVRVPISAASAARSESLRALSLRVQVK
jgi:hypothetical protein